MQKREEMERKIQDKVVIGHAFNYLPVNEMSFERKPTNSIDHLKNTNLIIKEFLLNWVRKIDVFVHE